MADSIFLCKVDMHIQSELYQATRKLNQLHWYHQEDKGACIRTKSVYREHDGQQTFSFCLFQNLMKILNPTNISEVEASVLGQCLEFTSKIAKNNKSFTLNLELSNGFIFNFCNNEKRNSLLVNNIKKKKPSPSTLARNKIRMKKVYQKEESFCT